MSSNYIIHVGWISVATGQVPTNTALSTRNIDLHTFTSAPPNGKLFYLTNAETSVTHFGILFRWDKSTYFPVTRFTSSGLRVSPYQLNFRQGTRLSVWRNYLNPPYMNDIIGADWELYEVPEDSA